MNNSIYKNKTKYLLLIILLILFYLSTIFNYLGNTLKVHFLNIGQGDSILLELPHYRYILIDTGEGNRVVDQLSSVLPFWVRNIDLVLCTHADSDHMDGTRYILEKYNVSRIFVNNKSVKDNDLHILMESANSKGIPIDELSRGDSVVYKDIRLDVLWPKKFLTETFNQNQHSLVLNLKFHNFSFLFTGDIEKKQEDIISNYFSNKIDVLKVAHHGSKTSTSAKALSVLSPKIAVISAGVDNKFSHPSEEVLSTLKNKGVLIYRTDKNDTISIHVFFK